MNSATWFLVTPQFVAGWQVLWRSLLQHNPRSLFGEVVIQTDIPTMQAMHRLPECEGVRFVPMPPTHRYADWPAFEGRVLHCYAKLAVLEQTRWDQIVVMDTDMVCTGDVSHVYEGPGQFTGVGVPDADGGHVRFNGGLWRARGKYLGQTGVYEEVARYARDGLLYDRCDQSALVVWLEARHAAATLLPIRYNLQLGHPQMAPDLYRREVGDCRILHITGPAKPWLHPAPAMGWRERFRGLWERAAAGEVLTAADVAEVNIDE